MELSTELKTASFFYNFHIANVYQQIINDSVKLNLSYLLSHLLNNYYHPPNHVHNFIREIKIRIELPKIRSISSDRFFQFFYEHIADYDFHKTSNAPNRKNKDLNASKFTIKVNQSILKRTMDKSLN